MGVDIVYAAVTNPTTQGLLAIETSSSDGTVWAAVTPGTNYMGNAGGYDSTIVTAGPGNFVYVGGQAGYLGSNTSGAGWNPITTDASGDGPHAAAHAMFMDASGNLLVGTDGGLWRYNLTTLTWSNLNGAGLAIGAYSNVALPTSNPLTVVGGSDSNGADAFTGSQASSASPTPTSRRPSTMSAK